MPMKLAGAFAAFFLGTYGHSNMVFPETWTERFDDRLDLKSDMWFNNDTVITQPITLPEFMRTFPGEDNFLGQIMAEHPWRRPGTAERREGGYAPCGIAGGNPLGCGNPPGPNCPGGGYGFGQDAFAMGIQNGAPVTNWQAGTSQEVGFRILANHGGGYSYRLCPMAQAGLPNAEYDCFQANALDFDGDTSWIDFDNEGPASRIAFQNLRTTQGTPLKGDGRPQQWSRTPVPPCDTADGGLFQIGGPNCDARGLCTCNTGTQFTAPAPGIEGYGTHIGDLGTETFKWSVRDRVKVPANLPAGDYVLSFRWDCEQTAQSWATCSTIRVGAQTAGIPPTNTGIPNTGLAGPQPAGQNCDPLIIGPIVIREVTTNRPQMAAACTAMETEFNRLAPTINTPSFQPNYNVICGCVTGFDRQFWVTNGQCSTLPGQSFMNVYDYCISVGLGASNGVTGTAPGTRPGQNGGIGGGNPTNGQTTETEDHSNHDMQKMLPYYILGGVGVLVLGIAIWKIMEGKKQQPIYQQQAYAQMPPNGARVQTTV